MPVSTGPWAGWSGTLRGIGGLATTLTVVLWVTVVIAALGAIASANRAVVIGDLLDAEGLRDLVGLGDRADDADNLVGVTTLLMLLASLTIFVLLVVWMWRVAKNAEFLGRTNPRFGPGWTIGGWFVPLANLVIPVLVVQDLWRGSDPATPRGDPTWRSRPASGLVGWWWVAHLLALTRWAGGDEATSRSELETMQAYDVVAAVGMAVAVVAAILLIQVVRQITARQEVLAAGSGLTVR